MKPTKAITSPTAAEQAMTIFAVRVIAAECSEIGAIWP